MNLALKDIRHGLFRFVLTCFGLGLLMTVVLAMIGIYNGLVSDALAVVKAPVADVWVVEAGTKGPFAEASSIPADTRDAVARMPGVAEAGAVNYQNVEAFHAGRTLRIYVVGYEPGRPGGPQAIAEGRGRMSGFYLGVSLCCILLAQPLLYMALGFSWLFTAFGRLLSMMSDGANTPFNWASIVVELALAALPLAFAFGFLP